MPSDIESTLTSSDSSGLGLSWSKKAMLVHLGAGNRRRSGWEAEAVKYPANGLSRMNGRENTHAAAA
jgi:hypothetical protein